MKQLVSSVMLSNHLSKAESTGGITHLGCHASKLSRLLWLHIRYVEHSGCHTFDLSRIWVRHKSGIVMHLDGHEVQKCNLTMQITAARGH